MAQDFRSKTGLNKTTVKEAMNAFHGKLSTRFGEDGQVIFNKDTSLLFRGISEETQNSKTAVLWEAEALKNASTATALERLCVLIREYTVQCVEAVSPMHELIGSFRTAGRLLHWYTQNIDGLEARTGCVIYTGLDERLNVARAQGDPGAFDVLQLHGGLNSLRCLKCQHAVPWDLTVQEALWNQYELPSCPKCPTVSQKGRVIGQGRTRLGMVLYGENNPHAELVQDTLNWDIDHGANLLLIAGTSLKAKGALNLVQDVASRVHQNNGYVIMVDKRTPAPADVKFVDFYVWAECDAFATALRTTSWNNDTEPGGLRSTDQTIPVTSEQRAENDDIDDILLMIMLNDG